MFQLYCCLFFIIAVFNSQFHVQGQDTVFECYSWGDPHVQTWHPKVGGQIRNQDCLANGVYTLVSNKYVDIQVHIKNKLATVLDAKFYNPQTAEVICHLHSKDFHTTTNHHQCEKHGVIPAYIVAGTQWTLNIDYPAASFLTTIRQIGSGANSYFNIYLWQQESLATQSTGLCTLGSDQCLKKFQTVDFEQESVRSSQRQLITNEQAKMICNQHVDAFFMKIRRAPYERSVNMNNTIASILAGCVDDVIFTGEIEIARAGLDVLMMEELTGDATSVHSIQTAIEVGIRAGLVIVDNAAMIAETEIRRIF